MRHDTSLDQVATEAKAWESDPVLGRSGGQVERYRLPPDRKARMSLSGSERNHLFVKGRDGSYVDVSGNSGIDAPSDGRTIAILDFDRDGLQDILLTSTNEHLLRVYRNSVGDLTPPNPFVAVRCVGGNRSAAPSSNLSARDAIGARVTVASGEHTTLRELRAGEGFAAQHSRTLIIGVRDATEPATINITWPSGSSRSVSGVQPGSLVTLFEDASETPDGSGAIIAPYVVPAPTPQIQRPALATFPIRHESRAEGVTIYTAMATWCATCKKFIPDLQRIDHAFDGDVPVYAIPIDTNDDAEKLASYIEVSNPRYELLEPDARRAVDFTMLAREHLGDGAIPFSAIVSANGSIIEVMRGVPTVSDVRRAIHDDTTR